MVKKLHIHMYTRGKPQLEVRHRRVTEMSGSISSVSVVEMCNDLDEVVMKADLIQSFKIVITIIGEC